MAGLTLERVGYDGPGDGRGGVPVWAVTVTTLMTLSASDLVRQVRADDARGPTPGRLVGCRRDGGPVGKVAAVAPEVTGTV
jgi:hypothetical protein